MSTLYVKVKGNTVVDITNNVEGVEGLHLGVKYIHGKDNVIFREDENGFLTVDRYRGSIRIYRYVFREDGCYMLTPIFVTEYKATSYSYRAVYNFLKKNFSEGFLLETTKKIKTPYEVIFSSWTDVSFNYKFTVRINEDILNKSNIEELKTCLLHMQEFDLLELHRMIGGKSIYIDTDAVSRLRTLPNVYIQSAW